ncbi:hypothetical protein Pelo_6362 [Pelomyxa schiedti]|nr:hypothetical protein Pelo_6362 [Pelomyxa schiedti]
MTTVSAFQLISRYAIASTEGATCESATAGIIEYEYYFTDNCQIIDCFGGLHWMESWSCQMAEPDPWVLVPDPANPPYMATFFTKRDTFCNGDNVTTTKVWPSTCIVGSASMSVKFVEEDHFYIYQYQGANCTGSASVVFRLFKATTSIENCYCNSYFSFCYDMSRKNLTEGYQTIEYYTGNDTNASIFMVEQYYSLHCKNTTVPRLKSSDNFFENWFCTNKLPDPFEGYWPDAILSLFYGATKGACGQSCYPWRYRRALTRHCIADQDPLRGHISAICSSEARAASLDIRIQGDANCTGGSTVRLIWATFLSADYCYQDNMMSVSYSELHCDPPNPAYQVVETLVDSTNLLQVDISWTQYCVDSDPAVSSSNLTVSQSCELTAPTFVDIDFPITVTRYADPFCTKPLGSLSYFSPECRDSNVTGDSYYCSLKMDDSLANLTASSCSADLLDECRGACSNVSTPVYAYSWDNPAGGCFWDSMRQVYVNVEPAPANPAWQVIYTFPGPVIDDDDDYRTSATEVMYSWSDNCVEYDIGWLYYNDNVMKRAVCMSDEEPDLYSVWADAYVVQVLLDSEEERWEGTWAYNPGCVNSSGGDNTSYSHVCNWDQDTFIGTILVVAYSAANCTGNITSSTIVSTYAGSGSETSLNAEKFTTKYYCLNPNQRWQIIKEHIGSEPEDPIYRVTAYIKPFCETYSEMSLHGSLYDADCREIEASDPPQGMDYFNEQPVEILWFSSDTCTNLTFTSWYSLDCLTVSNTEESSFFLSYCSVANSQAIISMYYGKQCPTQLEDVTHWEYIVTPKSGEARQQCNVLDSNHHYDTDFYTGFYQIYSCGAYSNLVSYNMDILFDGTNSDCTWGEREQQQPLYGSGTLTRFCEYSQSGTCEPVVSYRQATYFINRTCLSQSTLTEIAKSFTGGAVLLYSSTTSCNTEDMTSVYYYRGGDCQCTESECWSLYCTHTIDTDDEWDPGSVSFTHYTWDHGVECDHDTRQVTLATDSVCDDGRLWICGSSIVLPVIVLKLLFVVAAVLSLA